MKNIIYLRVFVVAFLFIAASCTSNTNDAAFLKKVEGRYLYNDDEIVKVYGEESVLLIDWRGAKAIKPSKIDDDTFYVKEMNAKIQFLTNPEDKREHLVFLPKNIEEEIEYTHPKMNANEKIPSQYLEEGNYKKALEGYLAIKIKDSLSPLLNYRNFDRKGRDLENKSLELAINVFKLNAVLHPKVSDVYVRLGHTYLKSKDTLNALTNYKKALKYNSGSKRIKEVIENLQGKEANKTN